MGLVISIMQLHMMVQNKMRILGPFGAGHYLPLVEEVMFLALCVCVSVRVCETYLVHYLNGTGLQSV